MQLLQVIELAPHMSPTRHFLNAAAHVELVETGICIGLERSAELAKMLRWMLSVPIRRIHKPYRGR
jgi:hypothetical protein